MRSRSSVNKNKEISTSRVIHSKQEKRCNGEKSIDPTRTHFFKENQFAEFKQNNPMKYKQEINQNKVIRNNNFDQIMIGSVTQQMIFSTKTNSSHQFTTSNHILTKDKDFIENEISKKVENYRLALNHELLKILAEERQNEDSRERMIAEAECSEERVKLDKIFTIERSQSSHKIVNFNK